ncbi:hypothetical protein C427_3187 [Paraglaciecola psychrophila 170]|uniref:Uncharacterized protein n=1 Tax=Paraglaciecola psychrophila 170 TaxID=1129794 RepID=K6Z338_9ALTE|nr:hypothetical protein C427_3187 [Paraglaciecola psychrophila 170]GAC39474.1 hypothetical protein GPSY_3863 [Paraglaciecola psychrophila 170]
MVFTELVSLACNHFVITVKRTVLGIIKLKKNVISIADQTFS